jgi:hypothetical protein
LRSLHGPPPIQHPSTGRCRHRGIGGRVGPSGRPSETERHLGHSRRSRPFRIQDIRTMNPQHGSSMLLCFSVPASSRLLLLPQDSSPAAGERHVPERLSGKSPGQRGPRSRLDAPIRCLLEPLRRQPAASFRRPLKNLSGGLAGGRCLDEQGDSGEVCQLPSFPAPPSQHMVERMRGIGPLC